MSDSKHVYGVCQYSGNLSKIEQILDEWGFIGLLIPREGESFILDGPYQTDTIGPRGPIKNEDLQDCLNEVAQVVSIQKAQFRCFWQEYAQSWDLIHVKNRFIRVPLELQPTLEALDDPIVREYYGVEYCVVQTH